MSKRVTITPQLQATIRRAIGDPDLDTSQIIVYEARFVTTEPVKKPGSLWDGARLSASVLQEMAEFMSKEGNAIPLHIMHETGFLPVGKVFNAQTIPMENGETELRGQFYLDAQDTENLRKIDTSIVDEVSIQVGTNHLYCSECNFDYMGEEAELMNFLTCTCNEGHTVGENGIHVRGVGLKGWVEVSLCGTGAAKKAKILGQSRQRLSKDMVDKLAANKNWEAGLFQLTGTMKLNEGENQMSAEYEALLAKYEAEVKAHAATSAELKASTDKVGTLEASVTELKASVEAKEKEVTELKAAADAALSDDETKVALEAANKEIADAKEILAPHVKAALVASGTAEGDIPQDLAGMTAKIQEAGLKLHQVVGAQSAGTKTDVETDVVDHRKGSFKL